MKLLVKLAVVALLGNAGYRVGVEYVTYFGFRDAVRQAVLFGPADDAGLRAQVMGLATDYGVPLAPDRLTVRRENRSVHVNGSYDRTIELAPGYGRAWHFTLALDVPATRASGL